MSEIMSLFIFSFKSRSHHRALTDPKSENDSTVLALESEASALSIFILFLGFLCLGSPINDSSGLLNRSTHKNPNQKAQSKQTNQTLNLNPRDINKTNTGIFHNFYSSCYVFNCLH